MKLLSNNLILFPIMILALILTACGSDDHGPTPVGLNLIMDGEVIATQEGTVITYPGDANFITVQEGETTSAIEVQFFLESGEPVVYETEDGYSLEYNITDTDVLNVNHPVNNNEWHLQLVGISAGSASFSVQLFHVSHSDFDSRNFAVQVVAPEE